MTQKTMDGKLDDLDALILLGVAYDETYEEMQERTGRPVSTIQSRINNLMLAGYIDRKPSRATQKAAVPGRRVRAKSRSLILTGKGRDVLKNNGVDTSRFAVLE